MNRGWIKLWRKIEDSFLYPTNNRKPFSPLEAWVDMLLMANHRDKIWEGLEIKRGALGLSLRSYSSRWKWGLQQTRTFFAKLQEAHMIDKKDMVFTTHVTICNYETYQGEQHTDNTAITHEQHTDNTRVTPTKELKKPIMKELKNFIIPTILEISDYCKERNNAVDAEKFFNHYESNGWFVGKNKMKDWKAAVRTWEKNSYDKPKSSFAPKTFTAADMDRQYKLLGGGL